jgi:hypothetical protein
VSTFSNRYHGRGFYSAETGDVKGHLEPNDRTGNFWGGGAEPGSFLIIGGRALGIVRRGVAGRDQLAAASGQQGARRRIVQLRGVAAVLDPDHVLRAEVAVSRRTPPG